MASSSRSPRASSPVTQTVSPFRSAAAVAAGGLVGSAARTGIGQLIPTAAAQFPTEVLAVNLIGSFLLGLYLARRERAVTNPLSTQFWAIGLLGSLTTFSAFSVDVLHFLAAGHLLGTVAYLGASVLGGLSLAMAGQRIGAGSR